MSNVKCHMSGFTIIELMVAVFIFALLSAGAANFLLSATSAQRDTLTTQKVLSDGSTLGEYIGRALRSAKKELNDAPQNCLTIGRGHNYEVSGTGDSMSVRFLNRQNLCQEFSLPLSGSKIQEKISTDEKAQNFGQAQDLTSSDVNALSLRFSILREGQTEETQQDSFQPRVTVYFRLQSVGVKAESINIVNFQTTISQRNFDVEK